MLKCIRLYAVHKHIVGGMEVEALFDFGVGCEQYVKPGYADEIQVQHKAHDDVALRAGGGMVVNSSQSEIEICIARLLLQPQRFSIHPPSRSLLRLHVW